MGRAVAAVDIVVDASLGATAADRAASGDGWRNLDHLAWGAPDLMVVNLGLNDTAQGIAFLSLFDLFGGGFTADFETRLTDGIVYGDAGLYVDVSAAYAGALLAMAS